LKLFHAGRVGHTPAQTRPIPPAWSASGVPKLAGG